MFHKPSEPKPGPSDTKGRTAAPLATTSEAGTPVAAASSTSASPPLQQVAPTAPAGGSNDNTPVANDSSGRPDTEPSRSRQQQQPSKLSYSVNKQYQVAATALHQHYLNYFNSNIPREDAKSHRARGSIFNSQSQHSSRQQQHQQHQAVFPGQDVSNQVTNQLDQTLAPPNQRVHAGHNNHHHHHQLQQHNPNHSNQPAQIYHIPSSNYPPSHNQNLNGNNNSNNPNHQHHYASPAHMGVSNLSRSVPRDDTYVTNSSRQHQMNPALNHRTFSTGAIASSHQLSQLQQQQQQQQFQPHSMNQHNRQQAMSTGKVLTRSTRQGQLDRDSEDKGSAVIKGELENDLEGYKNSELEAISSLERNLPIELSFLIRQQAHCMARMNYLDRQLRELRESAAVQLQHPHPHHLSNHQQQVDNANQVTSTSIMNPNSRHAHSHNVGPAGAAVSGMTHQGKIGNFILSDDSGGEYSRATISDDDELSSLLDQIAKSVRPADQPQQQQQQQQQQQHRPMSNADLMLNGQMHTLQQQQHQRVTANYSTFVGNPGQPNHNQHLQHQHFVQPHQQPYAILNQGHQLHQHQQAVPIFVMSSPIAVAHPSSINSNILPGVHFQPEPRYNQYYEDFYGTSNQVATQSVANAPTMQRTFGNSSFRSQQFDTSMSAVEQLVSQREKRQIISQLKSADNWLKMRASNNDQEGGATRNVKQATPLTRQDSSSGQAAGATLGSGDLRTTSSSTIKQESDRVIDETADG